MAAFTNKEYIDSIKRDPGYRIGQKKVELKIAEQMHDDVIEEAYHQKKREGRIQRTPMLVLTPS